MKKFLVVISAVLVLSFTLLLASACEDDKSEGSNSSGSQEAGGTESETLPYIELPIIYG